MLACAAAVAILSIPALSPQTGPMPMFVTYGKQPRALKLDPARIAVVDATGQRPSDFPGYDIVPVERQAMLAPGAYSSPVFVDERGRPLFPTPAVIVRLAGALDVARGGGVRAEADAALQGDASVQLLSMVRELDPGATLDRTWSSFPSMALIRLSVSEGVRVLEIANQLASRADIAFAEPDMAFSGQGDLIPNDPLFNVCWGLRNTGQDGGQPNFDMDAELAWDTTTGDPSIITVVIDVGVALDHPDLNAAEGFDATNDNGGGFPVNTCDRHGTPVAGCVAARINNNLGLVGIAPGTRAASARTFVSSLACNGGWSSFASWTVDTLDWAQSIGARVTNNSNYYGFSSAAIEAAYQATRDNGMVHFASAGNDASSSITYPARLGPVNAVAALNRFGQRASFSNWGNDLDYSAPGQTIASLDNPGSPGYVTGDYVYVNGTSFASPYAAGVAALVLSWNPLLNADQVETILASSATDLGNPGFDVDFGHGLLNAAAAIRAICPADYNLDSQPDFFDYLDFVADLATENARADVNRDSQVDFFDYLDFATIFDAGC
ncbi:MAG: S8 family serine peptidase [Planctomycetota bacterium]|nr:S8 family serine peptidase [Planctomycetota bacterium]